MTSGCPIAHGRPLVGNTLELYTDPIAALVAAHAEHGPVFRMSALGIECTVIVGPAARAFYLAEGERYLTRQHIFQALVAETGAEIFGAEGEVHERLRERERVAYGPETAAPFLPDMVDTIAGAVRGRGAGERLPLLAFASRLAFELWRGVLR